MFFWFNQILSNMLPQTGLPLVVRKKTNGSPHLPARHVWLFGLACAGQAKAQLSQANSAHSNISFIFFFSDTGNTCQRSFLFCRLVWHFFDSFWCQCWCICNQRKGQGERWCIRNMNIYRTSTQGIASFLPFCIRNFEKGTNPIPARHVLRPGDDATTSLPKASAMEALCDWGSGKMVGQVIRPARFSMATKQHSKNHIK